MNAYITHIATFLPNAPVGNDAIESVLGMVGGVPSRARARVLKSNGITQRHYAIDPQTKQLTHNNAQLTAEAVRKLLQHADLQPEHISLLACGSATPDSLLPPLASMVHGELAAPPCETMTAAGACSASSAALKYAMMAVASGQAPLGVVTGSELCSPLMMAKHFGPEYDERVKLLEENPLIAFEHEFLRWMLSDGAGACLIEPKPRRNARLPSLAIHWVESVSFAGQLDVCMYHLGSKRSGRFQGWKEVEPSQWLSQGFFNMGQDARMLGEHIGQFMGDAFSLVVKKRGLQASEVDWLLPHISSAFFKSAIQAQCERIGFPLREEQVFTNLSTVGNVGCASIFLMLEELLQSGRAKVGQKILCVVPESSRFNSAFAYLEVV